MSTDVFTENWALWLALLSGLVALIPVSLHLIGRTSRGRLWQVLRNQRQAMREHERAVEQLQKAEAAMARLDARSEQVKPRLLQQARDAAADARALAKITDDKVQVMTNHVRRTIFEEFPPARHEKMRAKYLPRDVIDGRPFSF